MRAHGLSGGCTYLPQLQRAAQRSDEALSAAPRTIGLRQVGWVNTWDTWDEGEIACVHLACQIDHACAIPPSEMHENVAAVGSGSQPTTITHQHALSCSCSPRRVAAPRGDKLSTRCRTPEAHGAQWRRASCAFIEQSPMSKATLGHKMRAGRDAGFCDAGLSDNKRKAVTLHCKPCLRDTATPHSALLPGYPS